MRKLGEMFLAEELADMVNSHEERLSALEQSAAGRGEPGRVCEDDAPEETSGSLADVAGLPEPSPRPDGDAVDALDLACGLKRWLLEDSLFQYSGEADKIIAAIEAERESARKREQSWADECRKYGDALAAEQRAHGETRKLLKSYRDNRETARPYWVRLGKAAGIDERDDTFEGITGGIDSTIADLRAQLETEKSAHAGTRKVAGSDLDNAAYTIADLRAQLAETVTRYETSECKWRQIADEAFAEKEAAQGEAAHLRAQLAKAEEIRDRETRRYHQACNEIVDLREQLRRAEEEKREWCEGQAIATRELMSERDRYESEAIGLREQLTSERQRREEAEAAGREAEEVGEARLAKIVEHEDTIGLLCLELNADGVPELANRRVADGQLRQVMQATIWQLEKQQKLYSVALSDLGAEQKRREGAERERERLALVIMDQVQRLEATGQVVAAGMLREKLLAQPSPADGASEIPGVEWSAEEHFALVCDSDGDSLELCDVDTLSYRGTLQFTIAQDSDKGTGVCLTRDQVRDTLIPLLQRFVSTGSLKGAGK